MESAVRQRVAWWHPLFDVLALFAIVGLVIGMLWQWLAVYFTIGGPAGVPTASETTGYWATAVIAIALTVFGLVVSLVRRSVAGVIGYLALGALVAAAILLFAVPQTDWVQFAHDLRDREYPVNTNYCSRTDSENCPGG